jgi:hypothetical protein
MNTFWTSEEIDYIKMNYSDKTDLELSKFLNKSIKSIRSKSFRLGLKKSKMHKSKMISKRNKMVGRNLTFDFLKEIALKYETRSDFQQNDPSAYTIARTSGILGAICNHMVRKNISTPQVILSKILEKIFGNDYMYNTRKIINPYELDIYFPSIKLAFEYDGKAWHLNDKINKVDICYRKGITLIKIKERNRNYELDIKQQLVENLNIIGKFKKIDEKTIFDIKIEMNEISKLILSDDSIREICNKYEDFSEFRKENIGIYTKLLNLKSINKFTSHMKKRGGITEESAKKETEKYIYLGDFIKNSYRFYIWIKKRKKEYLLENLILKQNKKLKYQNGL